ncbi:hypothetical protein B296_00039588 [Ensete ventricosum]|uniref:Uncharacterized protein n=1 Tax=Ensete ventricosum TaxID=4639 RepID=A0A426Z3B2_ENSVE|nr:hypothetical protein B296_00039588 [Ensete ventricosum]
MYRVDAFGNSLGVYRKLAEGIGSLLGWRKGVRQDGAREFSKKRPRLAERLSGVAEKLARSRDDDGPRYNIGIGPSSDDAVGSRRKFARRFAEGIGKLVGYAKDDHRKEDRRTYRKITGGCQNMGEIWAACSSFRRVNRPGGR